ncbi:hypothetical protein ACNUDN_02870 [Mycobacterium sp. smrl_JER01]
MVLGLSLTAQSVVWVLVDDTDGTITDHDVLEFRADAEIAGAAARGARSIATAGGHDVQRIRLTWSDCAGHDGCRLANRLEELNIARVEVVPMARAMTVMVDPDTAPGLALAYGAAIAGDEPDRPAVLPVSRGRGRRRLAWAVLGAAAAAFLAGLLLTSGAMPHVEQTATAIDQPVRSGPEWVAVRAPSEGTAGVVRKVVEPTVADRPGTWQPVPAQTQQIAPALPVAAEVPHLTGEWPGPAVPVTPVLVAPAPVTTGTPTAVPVAGPATAVPVAGPAAAAPVAGPAAAVPVAGPATAAPVIGPAGPEMTDPANLFSALP